MTVVLGTFRREISGGGADVRHQRRLITGKHTLRALISQLEDTGGTEPCVEARTRDLPIMSPSTCRRSYSGQPCKKSCNSLLF